MRLFPADLDERGQPVLVHGEQERALLKNADIFFGGTVGGVEGRLTNDAYTSQLRNVFAGGPCHLPLGSIAQTELAKAFLQLKPTRIKLRIRLDASGYPSSDAFQVASMCKLDIVVVKNSGGTGPVTWHKQLDMAIARRAWASAPPGLVQELHTPSRPPHSGGSVGPMTPPSSLFDHLTPPASDASVSPNNGARNATGPMAVARLMDMGFSEQHASDALRATNNTGIEAAAAWLLDRSNSSTVATPTNGEEQPHEKQGNAQTGEPFVGVAGILRREENRASERDRALGEAFTSLARLMESAEEMVKLASAFQQQARTIGAAGEGESAAGETEHMDEILAKELADLGIASPVTRETAGKLYFQELSRQLAAFIKEPVAAAGGVLPLPEVYRQFCRARFIDLVSPDDLLQAVKFFPDVGASLRLREFPSGVKAVQLAGMDERATCKRVAELAANGIAPRPGQVHETLVTTAEPMFEGSETEEGEQLKPWVKAIGPGISRADVAEALNFPLAVAGEYLTEAEAQGLLCRDDGPEGVTRYYINFFLTATA